VVGEELIVLQKIIVNGFGLAINLQLNKSTLNF